MWNKPFDTLRRWHLKRIEMVTFVYLQGAVKNRLKRSKNVTSNNVSIVLTLKVLHKYVYTYT